MRALSLILLAALGLALAWWWTSPSAAYRDLREAARVGDEGRLAEIVDFPTLRENLRTDLRAQLAEAVEGEEENPIAGFGVALGGLVVDGIVNAFVSPGGLAALARGNSPATGDEPTGASMSDDEPDWRIERRGLNRFAVHFGEEPEADRRPALVFRREGIRWRLIRVELPRLRETRSASR